MPDDQAMVNALAAIIHHVGTATGGPTLGAPQGTSGLGSSLGTTIGQSNQEGQSALDTTGQSPTGSAQATATAPVGSDAVGLDNPAVSEPYGPQSGGGFHPGIDLSIPVGTSLVAAESGKVTAAGNTDPNGYGNEVEITAADGTVMRYGHLSGVNVSVGDMVKRGQLIGKSGGEKGAPGSGNATGPHLHFEVRVDGNSVDPVPYLAGSGGIVKGSATSNPAAQAAPQDQTAGAITSILDKAAGKPDTGTQTTSDQSTLSGTKTGSDSDPGAVDAFLNATKQHESGGDYTIYNQSGQSNASGAYQLLGSTWRGLGGSTQNAAEASPAEQDRVARAYAMQLFNQFHSWRLVAIAWYGGPGVAQQVAAGQNPGSPQGQGSYLAYGDTISSMMSGGK